MRLIITQSIVLLCCLVLVVYGYTATLRLAPEPNPGYATHTDPLCPCLPSTQMCSDVLSEIRLARERASIKLASFIPLSWGPSRPRPNSAPIGNSPSSGILSQAPSQILPQTLSHGSSHRSSHPSLMPSLSPLLPPL